MSINAIYRRLESIPVGRTTSVNDRVVTRWAPDRWEVDTVGRKTTDLDATAQAIADDDMGQERHYEAAVTEHDWAEVE